jgi:hypothetical protein
MAKEVTLNGKAVAFAFFTRDEAQTVEALTQRIFPDDDLGPGARQAGVLVYIDRALSGAEENRQHLYRSGIRELDRIAHGRFGRAFADCAPADQDSLIAAMAGDALPDFVAAGALAFFEVLRAHTIEGMFSDPAHGGNRDFAGWKLLGYWGPQPSYSHQEQQLDAVIVRDRIYSAADYPLRTEEKA